MNWRPRSFWPFYVGWILLCAFLFVALSGLEDPSRPKGRILSIEAGARAAAILVERDPQRFAAYEVVHVARARRGEGAGEERWIVLLDRRPRTKLREAIVVELAVEDGALLRIRKPVWSGSRRGGVSIDAGDVTN